MAGRIIAAAKINALPARSGRLLFSEDACDMVAPFDDAHPMMPTQDKRDRTCAVPGGAAKIHRVKRASCHVLAMELFEPGLVATDQVRDCW
jgi:hypothetical protein